MARGKIYNTELFKERLLELYGSLAPFIKSEYKGNLVLTTIHCEKHGAVEVTPYQLLYSSKNFYCPKCGTENRLKQGAISKLRNAKESFASKGALKHNNKFDYSKVEYVNSKTKVVIICPLHGEFQQTPAMHLSGDGCKKCASEQAAQRYVKPFDQFVKESNLAHNNAYGYVEETYVNSRTHTSVVCPSHGDFSVTPINHIARKSGCPKCCHQISSHEDKLHERFPLFNRTNRTVIYPYHLDLYSEEHKLAIEVNGRYWHSEDKGKDSNYHMNKTEMCLNSDINLLHFWDDEIDFKFDIVASMINARLGLGRRVFARNTTLLKIRYVEGKKFFEENHLQGCGNPSETYGLFENGHLVSAMSFAKPRFSDKFEWEILRFACKTNTVVVGGASKLFKAFLQEHTPNSIVTYADRRYSEGGLYGILGFEFSHNSKPNYFYTKGDQNVSRYAAQKHKLPKLLGGKFDPEKSEYANMLDAGFVKVYDCGNKVFTWRAKP